MKVTGDMAKKITRKNFYMEIRRSRGRFLSILFIVALGVAFFSGIRASEPSMRITGDAYFDESDLMDIKAVSTLGITKEDVREVGKVKGVGKAECAYSADFLNIKNKKQYVLHVMSAMDDMNKITVSEGRMPQKAGECLVDDQMNYEVGETIKLKSGTDDPVTDTLKTDELKVVGKGNSPCYISLSRGSTTIGTGTINGFVVVQEKTFDLDVYTEMYVQVEGAKDLTAYTGAYKKKVKTVKKQIEAITEERGRIRKENLETEAEEKIAKAQKDLDDGKAESQQKLDDANRQITDGETQLNEAKEKIASGKSQIASARQTLDQKQKELDQAKQTYESGLKQLEQGKKQYEQGKAAYDAQSAGAKAQIQSGEQGLAVYRAELDKGWAGYQELLNTIEALKAQAAGAAGQIDAQITEEKEESEAGAATDQIQDKEQQPGQNDNGGTDTGSGNDQNQELLRRIQALEQQAQETKQTLEAREQEYQAKKAELDAAKQKLASGKAELDQAKAKLDASEAQLAKAKAQITSGQKQLDAGKAELQTQEQALQTGEAEIAENEAKLADARKEYEDGKKTSEEEIAKGEKKLADARKQIQKIKNPKWYVYNRSTLVEYDGFGENANRMRAIGKVFPVMFFLVAALISLTGMTRMVEEQRIEIGTMKALGYGNFSIASKYLGYALLATAGGSVIGVLVGEKVLPFIIIYAYEIMYPHIPKIYVPYHMSYAVMASAASIVCTMGATLASCYKELAAEPAVLMRPPAPKKGRRVFLERIGFIWKRMNFTWKSTIRNLMRYKKRFFMTIFGIGGCMALMLVGYGVKDSVYEIADIQYDEIQLYDGHIFYKDGVTKTDKKELKDYLKKDQDIQTFMDADMRSVTASKGSKKRSVYQCVLGNSKDAGKYVDFHDRKTKESYKLTDNGVIVSEKTAKLLNVKEGDTIQVKAGNEKSGTVKIAHICENYMGHYIYYTPEYYKKVYGKDADYNCIMFRTKTGYSDEQVKKAGEKILAQDQVLTISYLHDIKDQLDDMLASLNLVIIVLIVSAGMLAFVVLYNLNSINITERQRELATLKVLGFYDMEVAEYVFRENVLLTLIGAVVGIVFGKILHQFVIQTVEVDAAMFGRNINLPSFIYSFLFTIGFSLFVNWVMYFKLKKIDMVESLKSIE